MGKLVDVVYVGAKPSAHDNVAGSGKTWTGNGDVQQVTPEQAARLVRHADQWALADGKHPKLPAVPPVKDERIGADGADPARPLEKMEAAELIAYAKEAWDLTLDPALTRAQMVDAIEEAQRGPEPITHE